MRTFIVCLLVLSLAACATRGARIPAPPNGTYVTNNSIELVLPSRVDKCMALQERSHDGVIDREKWREVENCNRVMLQWQREAVNQQRSDHRRWMGDRRLTIRENNSVVYRQERQARTYTQSLDRVARTWSKFCKDKNTIASILVCK